MSSSQTAALATADPRFDAVRPCTRCDGQQALTASARGFARYRCSTCEMTVGVDLEIEPHEFLIDRGLPRAYTKDVFGDRLQSGEVRSHR